MAAFSTLLRSARNLYDKPRFLPLNFTIRNAVASPTQVRSMSSTMFVTASRWQWHKMKDYVHFYFLVAAIPLSIITFCANVFVGPATLTPIPEGYEPKYWEYYRNPITRFLARYIFNTPQKDYEKNLHVLYDESQIMKIRKLEKRVWDLQAERKDYRYNFFLPYDSSGTREFREVVKTDRDNME